jgi:hypothetical protein
LKTQAVPKPLQAAAIARIFNEACVSKDHSRIRVIASMSSNSRTISVNYDYFELNAEGIIVKAPRGHAVSKGRKVEGLDTLPPMVVFGREV